MTKPLRILKAGLLILTILCTMPMANAQLTKEQIKERKEIQKSTKKALNEKATKAARKEAKQLKKAGWLISPGALSIEKQLDRSYLMQMEYCSDMFPKYIMAEGQSIGGSYDAAKMQVIELAKLNLASQIQSEVTALIENSISNNQLGQDEAATVVETLSASKSLIDHELGRVLPVVEVYRTLPNKNKEVLVRLAYSEEMARQVALKAINASLYNKTQDLHDELDEIISNKKK